MKKMDCIYKYFIENRIKKYNSTIHFVTNDAFTLRWPLYF